MSGLPRAELQALIARTVSANPFPPGALLRVETALDTWAGSAGTANFATSQPAAPGMTFRIASNTKTFTAAMMLRLHEDGRLSLDDRIARYFPRDLVERLVVVDGVAYGSGITIRQMLNHTSGLYDWGVDPAYAQVMTDDPRHRWTPMEQVEFALAHGAPYGRPDQVCEYSDTGYVLASLIAEQVTGLPLAAAFRSTLPFDDLGLQDTFLESLEPEPPGTGTRIHQYLGQTDVTTALDPSFDLYGGGGFVSSLTDLTRFWRGLFEGRVFRQVESLAEMLGTVPAGQRGEAGLGVFRRRIGGIGAWCHGGFWGTFVFHDPRERVTVAACVNQRLANEKLGELVTGAVELVYR